MPVSVLTSNFQLAYAKGFACQLSMSSNHTAVDERKVRELNEPRQGCQSQSVTPKSIASRHLLECLREGVRLSTLYVVQALFIHGTAFQELDGQTKTSGKKRLSGFAADCSTCMIETRSATHKYKTQHLEDLLEILHILLPPLDVLVCCTDPSRPRSTTSSYPRP